MKKILILLSLLFWLYLPTYAQKTWHIGAEVGGLLSFNQLAQKGSALLNYPASSTIFGLVGGLTFNEKWRIETGIYQSKHQLAFGFRGGNGLDIDNIRLQAYQSWQIPLHLQYRWNLHKKKLFFMPFIGGRYIQKNTAPDFNEAADYIEQDDGSLLTRVSYTYFERKLRNRSILLEFGTGLEFLIFKRIYFNTQVSYLYGTNELYELEMHYQVNNTPESQGKITSKADALTASIGLKYPFLHKE